MGWRYVIYPINWKGWVTIIGLVWAGLIFVTPAFSSLASKYGDGEFLSCVALAIWTCGSAIFIFFKSDPIE